MIRSEIQLAPQITPDGLQFYWRIYRIADGMNVTLEDGFAKSMALAFNNAYARARKYTK
jgi:hypothetical protein